MVRLLKKYRLVILFLLAAGALFLSRDLARFENPNGLRVRFFDVGQGDATLVETLSGSRMLIDGGPTRDVMRLLSDATPFWDRRIDLVALTHPERDHVTGLAAVLEQYRVGRVLLTGAPHRLDAYASLLNLAQEKNIPLTLARAGETVRLGGGITVRILHPSEDNISEKALNETSVVLRLDYGKTSFLFTGDAGFSAEKTLLETGAPLDVDVLKVGHHGSKYSSGEAFLQAVTPRVAVIEAGKKNPYGHPAPEVLTRLAAAGARIFRTDRDSTVTLLTDGKTVSRVLPERCRFVLFCSPVAELLFSEFE